MAVSKNYNPVAVEDKWYQTWLDNKVFAAKVNKDKSPYTIVIPPPNVTGVLHMGHMLNNTIQDILIRKARMEGKEACWVPGTDHASIATETKVVNMLKEKGIEKSELSREEFLKHAWEWTEKYGGIILDQLKKLGASCDWDRTAFTLDDIRSESVINVFCDLYEKGHIYRGVRMVNWDPKGQTALSDEEVFHKEVQSKLYHIKYAIEGSEAYLVIATTRPETLLGDTAICINPNDERHAHLKGQKAVVPFINRVIPIIEDEYVDLEFGTGCLKVTPAHDVNDYELGQKHKLEVIDILNDDGTLNEKAQIHVGENRFVARKKIVKELEEAGLLVKVEEITNNVGYSERTSEVIEPKLSTQWFCKMTEMAKPALENVLNDNVQIHPSKFKNMYRSWMENIRDWCISRQLWWGHQIPAYYLPNGEYVVARNKEDALNKAKELDTSLEMKDLMQDNDVLDTWFSSWLWPMSVFNGILKPENEEFKYFYQTDSLVTGFDIIFFWVARMVMAGYEFSKEKPFKDVYITGMVRDEKRRKMSKQLGNSPDPLDLIKKYGADGVRVGMLLSAPAGNDLLFNEKLCEQGSKFSNKIWNAYRLIESWEVTEGSAVPNEQTITWFKSKMAEQLSEIEANFDKFRISDALMGIYKLFWDEFCDWYLEMVKPEYGEPIDRKTKEESIAIFERLLQIIHPFMPFITEELWSHTSERSSSDFITRSTWPKLEVEDKKVLEEVVKVKDVVSGIRNIRAEKDIAKKENLPLLVKTTDKGFYGKYKGVICALAGLESIEIVDEKAENAANIVVGADELGLVLGDLVNSEAEKEKLLKELEYTQGLLKIIDKKLQNDKFVNNAPEQVVASERKKYADAEAKIKALEASISALV